jgi:hypothetical protein
MRQKLTHRKKMIRKEVTRNIGREKEGNKLKDGRQGGMISRSSLV